MEFSKYTDSAINAMSCAQEAAAELNHSFVGSEHLLMGLIKCGDRTSRLLQKHGVTAAAALPYIDTVIGGGRSRFTDSYGNTQSVKRILELALYEAKSFGSELIGTQHILLSVMRERDCMGARILDSLCKSIPLLKKELAEAGASDDEDEDAVNDLFDEAQDAGAGSADEPSPQTQTYTAHIKPQQRKAAGGIRGASSTPVLDAYSRDLTSQAEEDRLDPVIGRDAEIERVILTLCRRSKNNPVLIGEPGVGKTAVAEGLAALIVKGAVPQKLRGCRLLSLDIGAMIAGTKYRGEFEERFKAAVDELIDDPKTILFIDELHTIVGAGASEGSLDASNILKPALARGELRVIGATTIDEYRRYIEKDAALERRFSPILVNEPDAEQTCAILRGLAHKYEAHHGVAIGDEAIKAAVELSIRFMAERRLPDKAIDLIDEAAAAVSIRAAGGNTAKPNEVLLRELETAAAQGDYDLAERLRSRIYGAQNEMAVEGFTAPPMVTAADVEAAVAERTGLDVIAVKNGLDGLEQRLKTRVFGQDGAITQLAATLRRAAAGLADPEKPMGVICFAGQEDTGRELLAVRLAEELFCGSVVRLNGAELMDDGAVYRLAGAPAGYRDSERGGSLTEYVRLHPYSVILIKNCTQCSEGVIELIAKIASEGVVEDGRGYAVSFRSCVVIILVEAQPQKSVGFGMKSGAYSDEAASLARKSLSDSISRSLDSIAVFMPHTAESLTAVASYELSRLAERANKRGINLKFDKDVAEYLAANCGMSAGVIKQLVTAGAEDALSRAILCGSVSSGDAARCSIIDGKYSIERL